MAEIRVPDYKNLAKLPSGSTISLWENKSTIHNVETMFPSTMLIPKDDNLTWETAIDPTKEWWFTAVTKTEWDNKIVNPETMLVDKIPGGLRVDNGWEQHIFPTNNRGGSQCSGLPHVTIPHQGDKGCGGHSHAI